MKVATRKVYDDVRNGIIAQLVTLLTMANEGIPTIKTGPLLKMQMKNGASSLHNVFVNGRSLYPHHDSIDDMYQSLYQRVMDEVTADRLSSPYTCFALEADEGTDSSNTSILIIYIRYTSVKTGEVSTTFLAADELPGTIADDIFCVMRKTMLD